MSKESMEKYTKTENYKKLKLEKIKLEKIIKR